MQEKKEEVVVNVSVQLSKKKGGKGEKNKNVEDKMAEKKKTNSGTTMV